LNEHGFIKSIHNKLSKEVYKWKIHDTYAGGVPDAFYSGPAGILFIEYKYVPKLPARLTTTIKCNISELQYQWLHRMYDQGHKVAVVLGVDKEAFIMHYPAIWKGPISKEHFQDNCVPFKNVAKWIEEQTLP
tara:strand:+ start:126 stop:521 length:396 start_codon:yes stop_codon:yes gene_type:complete